MANSIQKIFCKAKHFGHDWVCLTTWSKDYEACRRQIMVYRECVEYAQTMGRACEERAKKEYEECIKDK